MFDRLIVSEPEGAGARSRKNYFLISTLAVGILALTAVVFSIFAEDLSLGTDRFELSVLISPADMPAVQPLPPQPRKPDAQSPAASSSQVPIRRQAMATVNEPTVIPKDVSTAANTQLSRPLDTKRWDIGPVDTNPSGTRADNGRDTSGSADAGPGFTPDTTVSQNKPDDGPPPARPQPPKTPPTQTLGVINGRATDLPKPAYPAAALAINAQGKVDVQVLIDENGRVISAKAVNGHPMLRGAAENAARNAKFTPTLLSHVAVKVTGVIVYNFTRG
jgi:TonB family protein